MIRRDIQLVKVAGIPDTNDSKHQKSEHTLRHRFASDNTCPENQSQKH